MKAEIIRDATLGKFERIVNSRWFDGIAIAVVMIGGGYIIGMALWRIIFK